MKKICLIATFVCLVLSIALLTQLPSWLKWKKGDIKDFNAVKAGELESGDLVRGTIYMTEGAIAEREESHKTFGITTSKSTTMQYYTVYMENEQYILYGTGKKEDYTVLERLADGWEKVLEKQKNNEEIAQSDIPSESLTFEGEVRSMPNDLEDIFRKWYGDGFTTNCETAVYVARTDFSSYNMTVFIGFGFAGATIILAVVTVILYIKGRKPAKYGY